MSLINDALRKARKAASERDAERPAIPFQGTRVRPPARSPDGVGATLMILIALAAATLGAGAAWWLFGRGDTSPVARDVIVADAAMPAENPAAKNEEQPRPGASTPSAFSGAPDGSPENPAFPLPHRSAAETTEAASGAGAARMPRPATGTAGPDADQSGSAVEAPRKSHGERIFVIDADLGYATLSLGYIVFRPNNPFAEINDIDVHVGSEVAGFVVEAIEVDRVLLRDDRGPLILRVP
ncbi:MAG: hypothetical protein ACC742_10170 [Thermoanaerobaculales bacterium]